MRRFVWFGPALVVFLLCAVTLVAGPAVMHRIRTAHVAAVISQAQSRLDQGTVLDQINLSARAIADSTMPGVVHVVSRAPQSNRATGAGWVYDRLGHIVTNAHVVAGSASGSIRVECFDGRVRRAALVGIDEATDIAVLRIDLPEDAVFPLRRATGEPVHVGERVFAFGSPFGIKFSMSEGIISGLGRSEAATFLGLRQGYTNFIQTDAAMNPGNSGGPLVDARGRVVGMNTAIANSVQGPNGNSDTPVQGQSAGIGFAMPLETVESVVNQLIENPIVLRGYLGIQLGNQWALANMRDTTTFDGVGALVNAVTPGQPAATAGLQRGDIITAIDGRPTPDADVLRAIISIRNPGDVVPLTVWRSGQEIELQARLGGAYVSAGALRYIEGSETLSRREIFDRIVELEASPARR